MTCSQFPKGFIKTTVKEIFAREKDMLSKEVAKKAHLILFYVPFVTWNSFTLIIRFFSLKQYFIIVNKASIAREKTECKMRFIANAIMVHEFEHIKIFSNSYENEEIDYMTFMSLLEAVSYGHSFIAKNLIDSYLSRMSSDRFIEDLRYYSSSSELVCINKGLSDSMSRYGSLIGEKEYAEMNKLITAIEMIWQHYELRCANPFRTENRFIENIIILARIYKKKKQRIPEDSFIRKVLPNNDDFLNPIYLYERRNELNKDLIDNMLLQILLVTTADFKPLFLLHAESKAYISSLMNQYIIEKNRFIIKSNLSSKLLNEEFLHENMAHIKHNFDVLKKKAVEYEIDLVNKPAIWIK